ncbi:unnamed protein product [Clonostachys rosea f. rosea IK726]|nr:unnamed protein product [Clonostachys rosea f. rosea IK726]
MIPFQYLEPLLSKETLNYVATLLERCIEDVRTKDGFHSLPNSLRTYVALCLIEVSKWPGLTQKRRAIHAAQEVMAGIKDDYAESNIAQRQVVLDRLDGKMSSAIHGIDSVLSHLRSAEPSTYLLHASAGHATVERALNFFQHEQLGKSLSELDTWSPLSQVPAPAEVPVLLRINLLRAKMLRFQGNFTQSHTYLVLCSDLIKRQHPNSLLLDKEKTSVACELVYVLRELDRPEEAEQAAVHALSCPGCAGNERSLLLLAYAEALFAQGRLGEAEAICQQPQDSPSKMTRLLSFITMAKIRHTQSRLTDSMSLWTQALQAMNKFPPTSGHATRAIHVSISQILNQQGVMDTAEQTQVMIRDLESLLDRAEAKYWIPGLRHWCDYLTSA